MRCCYSAKSLALPPADIKRNYSAALKIPLIISKVPLPTLCQPDKTISKVPLPTLCQPDKTMRHLLNNVI